MSQLCNRISNLYLLSILKKYIGDESQHKSITLQMNNFNWTCMFWEFKHCFFVLQFWRSLAAISELKFILGNITFTNILRLHWIPWNKTYCCIQQLQSQGRVDDLYLSRSLYGLILVFSYLANIFTFLSYLVLKQIKGFKIYLARKMEKK